MQPTNSKLLITVFVTLSILNAVSAAKCKNKRIYWAQAGHNEDCASTCKRNGKRVPINSGGSLLCAEYDGENFDSPLPTDWVSGAFYDIAKDPSSPEKECYIARHYFESGDDLTQPIADTSNFYCGCWYNSKACKPWIPKWVPHGPHVDNSDPTCQDVCASKGLVVVDHTGSQLSYNWICRESSIKAHIGYEHYNGTEMTNVCHFVSQDDMDAGSYNDYSSLYDCLCQRK